MKKIVIVIFLNLFIISQTCYALNIPNIEKNYSKYYSFNKQSNNYQFKEISTYDYKNLNKNNKLEYKTIKKLNKLCQKGKSEQVLKKYPYFTPARFSLYLLDTYSNNYYAALNKLEFIKNNDNSFDKKYLAELIFMEYYKAKQYNSALNELYLNNNINLYAFIADCYLNTYNLQKAMEYATKVPKSDKNYYFANEVIFKIYYRQNNKSKAKSIALNLINLNPASPDNYIRYATCEDNKNIKLKYLYEARNRIYTVKDRNDINQTIIDLEQTKINNVCNSMKIFTERPDWNKIIAESNYSNYSYWEKRQDNFFKDANECITKYSGPERAKCFESVNRNQYRLTDDLNKRIAAEQEQAYRNTVVQQNNEIIRQQYLRNIELMNINSNLRQQNNQLQNINNQLRFNNYSY